MFLSRLHLSLHTTHKDVRIFASLQVDCGDLVQHLDKCSTAMQHGRAHTLLLIHRLISHSCITTDCWTTLCTLRVKILLTHTPAPPRSLNENVHLFKLYKSVRVKFEIWLTPPVIILSSWSVNYFLHWCLMPDTLKDYSPFFQQPQYNNNQSKTNTSTSE